MKKEIRTFIFPTKKEISTSEDRKKKSWIYVKKKKTVELHKPFTLKFG